MAQKNTRCPWCEGDEDYINYHDHEWGVPTHDDRTLFEFLILESFQAGLSWLTILKKRPAFEKAFAGFDPEKVANYGEEDIQRLLNDKAIIRNKLKIKAAITNAECFLQVQKDHKSFAHYLWEFMGFEQKQNSFGRMADVPAKTPKAEEISKALKKRGFSFVGPTIMYAYMQAVGMVNDHLTSCPRHKEINKQTAGKKYGNVRE